MALTEREENLLEAIAMAAESGVTALSKLEATETEDSKVHVTAADIASLEGSALVVRRGDEIDFTEGGRAAATAVLRRHRLAEMLLYTLLGVDRALASEIGCRIEHGLREEMLGAVCTLLGHPSACPHGKPIPPGDCCRDRLTEVPCQIVPITALKAGERARIVYIKPRVHERVHRLSSLGLNPGEIVVLHRRHPAFVVRWGDDEIALDSDVASDIQVSRAPSGK
jgi:DtxR family transcriptional regulator, Mn-dependent transcriptional regulator